MAVGFQVFLLDDDVPHSHSLARQLKEEGFEPRVPQSLEQLFDAIDDTQAGCVIAENRHAGRSGREILDHIAAEEAPLPVIFLVARGSVSECAHLMRLGAADYLGKPAAMAELRDALRRAEAVSRMLQEARNRREAMDERLARLTPRERQILGLVLAGHRNKQIAFALSSQESTVKVHRSRLMRKLETRSLAELMRLAPELDARVHGARHGA